MIETTASTEEDGGTEEQSNEFQDPFQRKIDDKLKRTQEVIGQWFGSSMNSDHIVSNTYLMELILRSSFMFDDSHFMTVLELSSDFAEHVEVYIKLKSHIVYTAKLLYEKTGYTSLLEFPLTNIQDILHNIATMFSPILLVPGKVPFSLPNQRANRSGWVVRGGSSNSSNSNGDDQEVNGSGESAGRRGILSFAKYNEMWILVLLLKQEFEKVVKEI
ncbi:uncharacterized protein RJT20DRAFT_134495 [Scheffersomyces xylosifermentans]|uniref:uncharacterized protein n=1 Tax=Scheffersomyces xylosifermentans TaxID=1304137 RepID=UPI00315CB942